MRKRIILFITVIGLLGIGLISAQAQDHEWDLQDLIEIAVYDIDDYWRGVFAENKLTYHRPEVVLFSNQRIRSGCGIANARTGPFYCPRNHTIYLPYGFMQRYLDNVGDFSVVLIVAHEWGHAIQRQAGELRGLSIHRELQADCYAGSYARHAANDSENVRLDPGDLDEGATMLFLVGDRNVEWFDDNAHGTSDQRIDAYIVGLETGYGECDVS